MNSKCLYNCFVYKAFIYPSILSNESYVRFRRSRRRSRNFMENLRLYGQIRQIRQIRNKAEITEIYSISWDSQNNQIKRWKNQWVELQPDFNRIMWKAIESIHNFCGNFFLNISVELSTCWGPNIFQYKRKFQQSKYWKCQQFWFEFRSSLEQQNTWKIQMENTWKIHDSFQEQTVKHLGQLGKQ